MDISEVAKATNIPGSTLRYYEEKGLIKSIGRNGLKRVFPETILNTLALISLGRNVGFSLSEIQDLLVRGTDDFNRNKLLSKADELDAQIKQLTLMRDGLRKAAVCPENYHLQCPKFLRILRIASRRWRRSKNPLK